MITVRLTVSNFIRSCSSSIIILISYLELLCKKQLSLQLLYRKEEVAPHGRTELENKLEHEIRGRERVCQILERS